MTSLRHALLGSSLVLLFTSAGATLAGDAAPSGLVYLKAYHSEKCLNWGPAARDCTPEHRVSILPVAGAPGKVMIQDASGKNCIYSNRDGRFGWYTCNAAWGDQHWEWLGADGSSEAPVRNGLEAWRLVRSAHSGKCIYSNRDGRFGLYTCTQYADQFWTVSSDPVGVSAYHSGKCLTNQGRPGVGECSSSAGLDILPVKSAPGTVMLRQKGTDQCLYSNQDGRFAWYTCNEGFADQFWQPIAPDGNAPAEVKGVAEGYRLLKSAHSGQCLYSNQDGRFGLYTCTQQYADQFWRTRQLTANASSKPAEPAATTAPAEPQVINNAVSNLCLGVRGVDQHSPGTGIEVYHCNPGNGDRGRDNQWTFVQAPDGYVFIKNRVSNLCLGVRGVDQHTPGTEVEAYTCEPGGQDRGLDNQWKVVPQQDGTKQLLNRVSNLCLGVRGVDSHQAGTGVEVYHCAPGGGDPGRDGLWRFQGL